MAPFTIMFVADICGRAGRQATAHMVKPLKEKYSADYVIANVENAAGGFGVTPEMSKKIFSYGVDFQTSGNHIWDRMDISHYFSFNPRLIRPANFPDGVPGTGSYVDTVGDVKVGVINLMGRTYMKDLDCPFKAADRELKHLREQTEVIFVDFHAEATSEKQAMCYYLNGKVSAVIGTHTHVQTADEKVTSRGTAYLTDAGMTGAHDSVIGMQVKPSVDRFLTGMPIRFTSATEDVKISGAVIRVNPETGEALSIDRFREDFDLGDYSPSKNDSDE